MQPQLTLEIKLSLYTIKSLTKLNNMSALSKLILTELKKELGPAASHLTEEIVDLNINFGQQLSQGKVLLKDVLNISDEHMETLYALAYNYYQKNKYEDARKLFTLLCTYDPLKYKYWEGASATARLLNSYQEAIIAYGALLQLRPMKLSYYNELAECFLKIDQKDNAKQCCEAVLAADDAEDFRKENPDMATCIAKAKSLLKALKK